jgi:uncharacterized protein
LQTVIIVSDSHGLQGELRMIKDRHQNEAEAFIHCGDSELDYHSDEMTGFHKVRGNCDFDRNYQEDIDFSVGEMKFFVTHGHLYNVKMNLMSLSYRADEVRAQIVCFGHSHLAGAEKVGEKLFINPGSIRQPRGGACGVTPTYVKLSWDNNRKIIIEFLSLEGTIMKAFEEKI